MRRNLWKIVLIIAIAVLLLSGYFARRAQLETERKEIEERMWSSWFEPVNENMSKAIEEWDREGIASFCEREDKVYTSSINSVTEISPYLLAICIFELNLEIAQNQEDNALEDWWDIKRRSYK